MAIGVSGLIFFVILPSLLLIIGIILFIFSVRLFKKRKIILAIILGLVGLLAIFPPIYTMFRILNFVPFNRSLTVPDFVKEFTQINEGFSEIYKSDKKSVIGINVEIEGFINGKGNLLIIHQPYEKNEGILLELEGNIYRETKNTDWYTPECLIQFIPENEFIDGKILFKIWMY